MFNDLPFEKELREFLHQKNARFIDQTKGFYDADFALMLSDGSRFALEVKEKRQAYTVQAWPQNTPEATDTRGRSAPCGPQPMYLNAERPHTRIRDFPGIAPPEYEPEGPRGRALW